MGGKVSKGFRTRADDVGATSKGFRTRADDIGATSKGFRTHADDVGVTSKGFRTHADDIEAPLKALEPSRASRNFTKIDTYECKCIQSNQSVYRKVH